MTVIVTRNVEARYRGFLASAMLEVAPGVYVSPNLSKGVRERVWSVLTKWHAHLGNGAISLIFADSKATGGLTLDFLGDPPKEWGGPTSLDSPRAKLRWTPTGFESPRDASLRVS